MTGPRIVWAAVAAVLGEVLLAVGQPSGYVAVSALQIASSAALAALVTCGTRRLWDAAAARGCAEAVPDADGGSP